MAIGGGAAGEWSEVRIATTTIFATLTPDEMLELIDDLWGSLKPEDFEPTGEQQADLDRRLDTSALPWQDSRKS